MQAQKHSKGFDRTSINYKYEKSVLTKKYVKRDHLVLTDLEVHLKLKCLDCRTSQQFDGRQLSFLKHRLL